MSSIMRSGVLAAWCLVASSALAAGADGHGPALNSTAVGPTTYPLDKRYDQLDAKQKQALKALWEPMPAADEPPFPTSGLAELVYDVRDAASARSLKGTLTLVAHVDAAGKVTKVDVYASPDEQLARFAAWKLTQMPFKPARCGGAACAMQFPVSVTFAR